MKNYKIAFILNGGLGSLIIGMEYIKNFYDKFSHENNIELYGYLSPSQTISDSIARGASFLKEYFQHKGFNEEMKNKYDIVIEVVFFPYIHYLKNNINISEDLTNYLQQTYNFQKSPEMARLFLLKGNVKPNIYEWGMLNNKDRFHISDPLNLLSIGEDYSYTPTIYKNINKTLDYFGVISKQFITVQRGTNSGFTKESIRDWPLEYYNELVLLLKRKYPQLKIVQLGESIENCQEIQGVDICLLGKTDLEDVKILLANALLHIDGECGMVHLRKALKGGPSVVFMGAAPKEFFGYKTNINLAKYPCGSYCHGLTEVWYRKCIKWGHPKCMEDIKPQEVFEKIKHTLDLKEAELVKNEQKSKLQEILENKNILLDKEWVKSWLSKREIYDYQKQTIKIKELYVNILFEDGWKKIPIQDSPVLKYQQGDEDAYKNYIEFKNQKIHDNNVNSIHRYKKLTSSLNKKYDLRSLIFVNGANVILDGQHRACWLLNKFGPEHEVDVIKIYGNWGV